MKEILAIEGVSKIYENGFTALENVSLQIREGEIFALLGPNGAGKTTLINTICGIVNPSHGKILVDGHDNIKDFRKARSLIGLVPQELTTDAFELVINTVSFSRGLFGLPKNQEYVEKILDDLALTDKKYNKLMTLSGGMKRRVMIAKALSHEPKILFLDEPTAGVDVKLRESMWKLVDQLKKSGVTIILTTHYIEEAEQMADRIGVIRKGKIIVVEEKDKLMKKLGKKHLIFDLKDDLADIPPELASFDLSHNEGQLIYTYDSSKDDNRMTELIAKLSELKIEIKDLRTEQSSLEDIFVELVEEK